MAVVSVVIQKGQYQPQNIVVDEGDSVCWTNKDKAAHSVCVQGVSKECQPIAPKTSFTIHFPKPGVYDYHCNFHPTMHGRVEVKSKAKQAKEDKAA